ncbi:hypothetical protein RIR_jg33969.t1 [Rhizophagus irregularis DAOM 181602=DAOM 197198]|nr:hypothetical protein RIR_jg33969.t1 [Rhizophagus irregularis DAOM 181602=DAOM 197198]
MQWIEDSINKKFLKLYEFEEFKNVNKIYDGQCLEVYSAVYKVIIINLDSTLSPVELLLYLQNLWSY